MSIKVVLLIVCGGMLTLILLLLGFVCVKGGKILSHYVKEEPTKTDSITDEEFQMLLKDYKAANRLVKFIYIIGISCFITAITNVITWFS